MDQPSTLQQWLRDEVGADPRSAERLFEGIDDSDLSASEINSMLGVPAPLDRGEELELRMRLACAFLPTKIEIHIEEKVESDEHDFPDDPDPFRITVTRRSPGTDRIACRSDRPVSVAPAGSRFRDYRGVEIAGERHPVATVRGLASHRPRGHMSPTCRILFIYPNNYVRYVNISIKPTAVENRGGPSGVWDMPGDTADTDIAVEPSVRDITRIASARAARNTHGTGTLPSFSGILSVGRPSRPDRPGPALEYLTLQSLVVEHLRERTHRETGTETVERIETTGKSDATDGDAADTDPESTTVREYIRQQADGASDVPDVGPRDSDRDGDEHSLRSGDPPNPRRTDRQSDEGSADVAGPDRESSGAPTDVRRAPEADGLPPGEREIPAEPAPDADARPLGTTLDLSAATGTGPGRGADDPPAPGRPADTGRDRSERGGGSPGVEEPADPAAGRRASNPDRPPLVLADQPVPATAGDERRSGDPSLTVGSREASTSAQSPGDTPASAQSRQSSDQENTTAGVGTQPATSHAPDGERQDTSNDGVPVALDELDRPELDRFVDQLSEELARHERVERERRGG